MPTPVDFPLYSGSTFQTNWMNITLLGQVNCPNHRQQRGPPSPAQGCPIVFGDRDHRCPIALIFGDRNHRCPIVFGDRDHRYPIVLIFGDRDHRCPTVFGDRDHRCPIFGDAIIDV